MTTSFHYQVKRHIGNCYCFFNNKHYIGDVNGNLLEMSSDYYTDNDQPIISIRQGQHIFDKNELEPFSIRRLFVDMETGVGDPTTTLDPQAALSWSIDGGHSWSNEYWASVGKSGNYRKRLVWRRLGISRDRIFRLTISDPVKKVIIGAYVQ